MLWGAGVCICCVFRTIAPPVALLQLFVKAHSLSCCRMFVSALLSCCVVWVQVANNQGKAAALFKQADDIETSLSNERAGLCPFFSMFAPSPALDASREDVRVSVPLARAGITSICHKRSS